MMTIEERLKVIEIEMGRLKRLNRWLFKVILGLAFFFIIPLIFEKTNFQAQAQATGPTREIHANKFVLEDKNGITLALLAMDTYGGPRLDLLDIKGKTRASLKVGMHGPQLEMFHENGNSGVHISALTDGFCRMALSDLNGKNRVSMAITKESGGSLSLRDGNNQSRILLNEAIFGPRLDLLDINGKRRVRLIADEDGPSLQLSDEKGNYRFQAGKAATITPEGKTITYPESSLILFAPDGKVIWSAIK